MKQLKKLHLLDNLVSFIYHGMLCACSIMKFVQGGIKAHYHVFKTRFISKHLYENHFVNIYEKRRHLEPTNEVFEKMPKKLFNVSY